MGNYADAKAFNGVLLALHPWIALTPQRSATRERTYESTGSEPCIADRTGCHERYYLRLVHNMETSDLPFLSEGYVGMALAGGAMALGTLLLAGLIRRAARK